MQESIIKFSIITINLNNKGGLIKTIQSVISQTYQYFEFIIIDGGSDDGSLDIIKDNNEKITYWVSENDIGVYHAQNKGIKVAKCDYCIFLNSGDYFYNQNVLEDIIATGLNEDIVYGDLIMDNGKSQQIYQSPKEITLEYLLTGTICHQAAFIRRKLFDEIGLYNESFKIKADYDFFLKAFVLYNCSFRYINNIIVIFNTQGISSLQEYEEIHVNERNFSLINNLKPSIYDLCIKYLNLKLENEKLREDYNKIIYCRTYKLLLFLKKLLPIQK